MTVDLGSAVVSITGDTSGLGGSLGQAASMVQSFGNSFGPVGGIIAAVGVAAVGVGVATTKMAGDFQSSMTYLQTNAGELSKNMSTVSSGILAMAGQTGTATKDLASGMFMVESAGYRGSDALKVLLAAAEGAKVGHADLSKVTDVLTTSMHDYHMQSSMAIPVMNSLIAAVGAGKMSMDDLNGALTNVLPVASKAGISISDVEGALAAMAQAGDRGAGAGTHLSQMFSSLQNPAAKGKAVLAEIGLTTQEVSDKMKVSLPGAIQMMYDALAKKFPVGSAAFNAAAAALVGGNKQMKAWNELTGSSFADLTGGANLASAALHAGGASVQGWAAVQGDFNQQMDEAKGSIEAIGIKIGTALLPMVSSVMGFINPLIGGFSDWISSSNGLGSALGGLGTVFQPVTSFFSGIGSFIKQNSGYFTEFGNILKVTVGQAFGILNDAIGGLVPKTSGLKNGFAPFFSMLQSAMPGVESFVHMIGDGLVGAAKTIGPVITQVGGIIGGVFAGHLKTAESIGQGLSTWFTTKLMPAVKSAMPGFQSLANTIMTTLVPGMFKLWAIGQGIVDNVAPKFVKAWEAAAPVMIRLYGIIAGGLSLAIKNLMPYILQAGQAIATFAEQIVDRVLPSIIQLWNNISVGLDWLQSNWKFIWPSLSLFLKGIWDGISGIIKIAWALISGIIKIGLDIITGQWGQAWTDMKDMLGGIWDGIKTLVQGFIEQLQGVFGGLAQMAINWGKNLIAGFVQGIQNSLGSIGSVMGNVVNTIGSFLPHSPAKQGELSHLNEYGPSLVLGISEGITKNVPMLQHSLNLLMQPVGHAMSPSNYPSSSSYASSSQQPVIHNHVYIDGREMAEFVAPRIVQSMRMRTGSRF